MRITVRNLSRKVNNLNKFVLRYKNYNRVHQIYQFHQNKLISPCMIEVKVFKDIRRWVASTACIQEKEVSH